MDVLLIEQTFVVYSKAPGELDKCSVVCFPDSYIIVHQQPSHPFRIDNDPVPSYNFPNNDVVAGLRSMIESVSSEDELKGQLSNLIGNNPLCIINFSDFKKVKVKKGLLGVKSLKVSNGALEYVSFSAGKQAGKDLVSFYSKL